MLSRMLLHLHEPLFPVKDPSDPDPGLQRRIRDMQDPAVFFPDIQDLHIPERAGIRILSAALREKGGPVQLDLIFFSICRTAGNDLRLKFRKMTVFIKQLFCHFTPYILSGASNPRRSILVSSTRFARTRRAI